MADYSVTCKDGIHSEHVLTAYEQVIDFPFIKRGGTAKFVFGVLFTLVS